LFSTAKMGVNKSVFIVILLSVALAGVLFSLPKIVVNNKRTQSKVVTDKVNNKPVVKKDSSSEVKHGKTSLTAKQQQTAIQLLAIYSSSKSSAKAKAAGELSNFYQDVRKFDSAAKYAEVVSQIEPTERHLLQAADLYYDAFGFAMNDSKSADLGVKTRELYQKVLDRNPNLLGAKANMAMTYVSTSNPMQGIMMLREIIATDPTNELALFNMGLLSMRSNQYKLAVSRFKQLLKVRPDNSKAQFYLGVSLAQLGQKPEALAALAKVKAKEKDPTILAAVKELEGELK
jgi:tetratricopeptide (TPR) repeat protein